MTKDDIKDRLLEEEHDHPNDQTSPFHIVLVDLKEASNKRLHCIKTPLESSSSSSTQDLKYVALSYRWGQLQETTVDTGVGYTATITSFDLRHFFALCKTICQETDLQSMAYVWVDAICVNQTNPKERKATIYNMTRIYDHANFILAVPDLHLAHVWQSNYTNEHILYDLFEHSDYLYYLIQGNMKKLEALDQQWLDQAHVPRDDQRLRQLLTTYTKHVAVGLATDKHQEMFSFDHQAALSYIYETTIVSQKSTIFSMAKKTLSRTWRKLIQKGDDDGDERELEVLNMDDLHICNNNSDDADDVCPFKVASTPAARSRTGTGTFEKEYYHHWKYALPRKSEKLRQSMKFFIDRILDWSMRAWVVSEFYIAKNKNNKIKYWFLVLGNTTGSGDRGFLTEDHTFFTFDFADSSDYRKTDIFYPTFHAIMRNQLGQQTFLEKMLKSQASKHEDRFHAILPSSEYKSILDNKEIVEQWSTITTLPFVKVELYKWMTTKHKLELLFLSGFFSFTDRPLCPVKPTFATSTIQWPTEEAASHSIVTDMDDPTFPGNFDLANPSTIQLVTMSSPLLLGASNHHHSSLHHYKLTIRPREYYRKVKRSTTTADGDDDDDDDIGYEEEYANYGATLQKVLGLNLAPDQHELILIPTLRHQSLETNLQRCTYHDEIILVGCSTTNHWILTDLAFNVSHPIRNFPGETGKPCEDRGWELCSCDEHGPGFDIY